MTDRELELWIDRALPAYAGEPEAGIAGRVLARAREQRRGRWLAWTGFAAAAATAALFVIVVWRAPEIQPPPRIAKTPPASPIALPIASPITQKVVATAPPAARTVPFRRAAMRRKARLTRQEHELLVLVNSNPALAERVLVEAPRQMAEPLRIEPIRIQPLAAASGE